MAKEFKIPVKEIVLTAETYNELEQSLENYESDLAKFKEFESKVNRFFKNLAKCNVKFERDVLDHDEIRVISGMSDGFQIHSRKL